MVAEANDSKQHYWLAMESFNNWKVDKSNDFRFTGVTEFRSKRAKLVKKDDLVFVYVPAPHSAFSDIRRVVQDGISRSPHTRNYDLPCSVGIVTASLVTLEIPRWAPMRDLVGKLSFVKPTLKWGHAMRVSFRRITRSDALTIAGKMAGKSISVPPWTDVMTEISRRGAAELPLAASHAS